MMWYRITEESLIYDIALSFSRSEHPLFPE